MGSGGRAGFKGVCARERFTKTDRVERAEQNAMGRLVRGCSGYDKSLIFCFSYLYYGFVLIPLFVPLLIRISFS